MYKRQALLQALMRSYPHPAQALYLQAEFPDGVFSRVHVQPGSDDELILSLIHISAGRRIDRMRPR